MDRARAEQLGVEPVVLGDAEMNPGEASEEVRIVAPHEILA
jgi:hypothetical protein